MISCPARSKRAPKGDSLILLLAPYLLASVVAATEPKSEPKPLAPEVRARIETLERLASESRQEAAIMMQLANAYAAAGDGEKVTALLQRIADGRSGLVPTADAEIFQLAGQPGVERALAAVRAASPIVKRATVAFRIEQPDLVPEGLAYDPGTHTLFLGGMYTKRILAIDRKKGVRTFAAGDDIAGPVLGLKVHQGELWAVTCWPDGTRKPRSSVLRFEIRTSKLLGRYVPDDQDAALNDLTVSGAGEVFVSDAGRSGALYRIVPGSKTIEPLLPPGSIRWGNGIVVTGDGKTVFLGNWRGIWRIDVASRTFARLEHDATISASAIDGLYLHRGALVGIQNWTHPGRVVRWTMSSDQKRLVRQEVLESGNAALEEPTTGTIAGDTFYFIANSQIQHMSEDGSSLKRPVDSKTVILQLSL